jgi:hypothetical protein
VNNRILYFFDGRAVAILAQGLSKEDRIPSADIDVALKRKRRYEQAPELHTFEE